MNKFYIPLAAILLLCLAPMPYGYFQLVRMLSTIAFGVMAYRYLQEQREALAYTFGGLALLFQPIYKIALGRTVWNIVDVVVAAGLIALFLWERRNGQQVGQQGLKELRLSRLVITDDHRLVLPDYNDVEIKMEPLVKAVYLLFLNHPEGILFKHLPDYREELTQIYIGLKPNGLNDKILQSIEDVTNPMMNSINEKCARIRGAFLSQMDDHIARHYYIEGRRGEAKRISLPRNLVICNR